MLSAGYSLSTPSSFLLDTYPGAAAAYSLRKLRSGYTGPCVRVRRSSDNAEQDIGFSGSPPTLDETALLNFVGSGDGFVTTWYGQNSNLHDLTQTREADQPQIVNSGVVVTDGGNNKAAIDTTDTNQSLINNTDLGDTSSEWTLSVVTANTDGSGGRIIDSRGGLRFIPALNEIGAYFLGGSFRGVSLSLTSTDHKVGYQLRASGSDVFVDGNNTQSNISYETIRIDLKDFGEETTKIQEFILWESIEDLADIQSNQKSFY